MAKISAFYNYLIAKYSFVSLQEDGNGPLQSVFALYTKNESFILITNNNTEWLLPLYYNPANVQKMVSSLNIRKTFYSIR